MKILAYSGLSGVCFAAWVMFLNASGLKGLLGQGAMIGLALIIIMVFISQQPEAFASIREAKWWFVVGAGVTFAVGMIALNYALSLPGANAGAVLLMMVLVQIGTAAIYYMYLAGDLRFDRVLGIAAAGVAGYLLTR